MLKEVCGVLGSGHECEMLRAVWCILAVAINVKYKKRSLVCISSGHEYGMLRSAWCISSGHECGMLRAVGSVIGSGHEYGKLRAAC
jgi:hypothetical protein